MVDVVDQNGEEIDEHELVKLVEDEKIVGHSSGNRTYLSFKGDCARRILRITHRHDVPKRLLNWIRVGLGFGVVSALLVPIGLLYSLGNGVVGSLNVFVTYPVFVITTLIVIKGWLFLKDLDSQLELYNTAYIVLVALLIIELVGIFASFCLMNGTGP